MTSVPGTVTVTPTGATDQVAVACGDPGAPDRIYSFTAPETATYVVGTPGVKATVAIVDRKAKDATK